jgi:hypothetical protein
VITDAKGRSPITTRSKRSVEPTQSSSTRNEEIGDAQCRGTWEDSRGRATEERNFPSALC